MDSYESMVSHPLPGSYPMPHHGSFPQFSENQGMPPGFGNVGHMSGSFADTHRGAVNSGMVNFRGGSSFPMSQNGVPSSYHGNNLPPSSSPFSMPYDPPTMASHQLPQTTQNGNLSDNAPHSQAMYMPASQVESAPQSQHSPPPASISNYSSPSTYAMPSKPVHSCTYCGLVLSSANALVEHKRIHTGDRPFGCHICGKKFTQKAHLNIHKRTHTGEKPYACHICSKRFAQSSHLGSHVRTHTGEKPFVCGICSIGFTQKQRLDAHLKKHLEQCGPEAFSKMMSAMGNMDNPHYGNMAPTTRPRQNDSRGFMPQTGSDMPHIKQEIGDSDDEQIEPNVSFSGNGYYDHAPDVERGMMRHPASRDEGSSFTLNKDFEKSDTVKAENVDHAMQDMSTTSASNSASTSSFSSEGMFLHPSGYVAYGGIEDQNTSDQQSAISHIPDQSSQQGASRRKSHMVRKLPMSSQDEEEGEDQPERNEEDMGPLQKFSPLQKDEEVNTTRDEQSEHVENIDAELVHFKEENTDVKSDATRDVKQDPTYHTNASHKNMPPSAMVTRKGPHYADNQNLANRTAQFQQHPSQPYPTANGAYRWDSQPRPVVPQETISHSAPKIPLSDPSAAAGSRISLVNFTAEELLAHLMKRDDIHKCQFCCLVFQDSAMYHIHRNMHDRTDPRRCNLCGQMMADKYDFTAHFLSMHKT